jgi:hypothetical protein
MAVAAAVPLVAVWPAHIHFRALFVSTAAFRSFANAVADAVADGVGW